MAKNGSKHGGGAHWNDTPVAKMVRAHLTSLECYVLPRQFPLVYHEKYNISFFGVEKLHPFDSCKYEKIVKALIQRQTVEKDELVSPLVLTDKMLLDVHTPEYLDEIKTSRTKLAEITELAILRTIPNAILQRCLVTPLKYQAGGTVVASLLALERGWAINVGGGMHHAYYENGMGWCAIDDIMLAVRECRRATQGLIKNILVIDLDVHQGNGFERDKLYFNDDSLYILDMYNPDIFPADALAKAAINLKVEVPSHSDDSVYLSLLSQALKRVEDEFEPHLIIYVAGTDVLSGDPLGLLDLSREAVVQRDEMVWNYAAELGIPLCMLLAGGYSKDSADVITNSISNLVEVFRLREPDNKLQRMHGLEGIYTTAEMTRASIKPLVRTGTEDSLHSATSPRSFSTASNGAEMAFVMEEVELLRQSIRRKEAIQL